ncbi:MAG: DCC1-like thiol-disulfide oxidoreductase family protein [Terracidiphilus sp.]|jgi:predicted DCC family thiol-disulfide oxidoreductase YuxK
MSEGDEFGGRVICLFDGECGFCRSMVRWLLRRDRKDRLRFAPLAGAKAAAFLGRHGYAAPDAAISGNTIVVVRDAEGAPEEVLMRSDAVVALLSELPQPWMTVAAVLRHVPQPVRNWGYRLIARGRHRISGQIESCPLPTAEERRWFL